MWKAITTIILLGTLPSARTYACEPPISNRVRVNPFVVQGTGVVASSARPVLPRNVDFSLSILDVQGLDVQSVKLRLDDSATGGEAISVTWSATREALIRIKPASPLAARANYTVYGVLQGQRQRLFQFQTAPQIDETPPAAVQVKQAVNLMRFAPPLGACDGGNPRIVLTVQGQDDQTAGEQLRFLVETADERSTVTAFCQRLVIPIPGKSLPTQVRITAIDLAGNKGPSQLLVLPAPQATTYDQIAQLRSCGP